MANGSNHLQQFQDEVEEVKVIMLENIEKGDERKGKLEDLEIRADQLERMSNRFRKSTKKVEKRTAKENRKMKIIIACIGGVVVLVFIILMVVLMPKNTTVAEQSDVKQNAALTTVPARR